VSTGSGSGSDVAVAQLLDERSCSIAGIYFDCHKNSWLRLKYAI